MRKIFAIAALAMVSVIARADMPANTVDIRAAYCLEFNQLTLNTFVGNDSTAVTIREKAAKRIAAIHAYLAPRIHFLDPATLADSESLARRDYGKLFGATSLSDPCVINCFSKISPNDPNLMAKHLMCTPRCFPDEAGRMKKCGDVSWLPN